jgi:hypothetical protein
VPLPTPSHFSLLTSHFSLLRLVPQITRTCGVSRWSVRRPFSRHRSIRNAHQTLGVAAVLRKHGQSGAESDLEPLLPTSIGSLERVRSAIASALATARSGMRSNRTANSSPPSRARVSLNGPGAEGPVVDYPRDEPDVESRGRRGGGEWLCRRSLSCNIMRCSVGRRGGRSAVSPLGVGRTVSLLTSHGSFLSSGALSTKKRPQGENSGESDRTETAR